MKTNAQTRKSNVMIVIGFDDRFLWRPWLCSDWYEDGDVM
jgi:hypothetical protein